MMDGKEIEAMNGDVTCEALELAYRRMTQQIIGANCDVCGSARSPFEEDISDGEFYSILSFGGCRVCKHRFLAEQLNPVAANRGKIG